MGFSTCQYNSIFTPSLQHPFDFFFKMGNRSQKETGPVGSVTDKDWQDLYRIDPGPVEKVRKRMKSLTPDHPPGSGHPTVSVVIMVSNVILISDQTPSTINSVVYHACNMLCDPTDWSLISVTSKKYIHTMTLHVQRWEYCSIAFYRSCIPRSQGPECGRGFVLVSNIVTGYSVSDFKMSSLDDNTD
jgi:hypothetical protein